MAKGARFELLIKAKTVGKAAIKALGHSMQGLQGRVKMVAAGFKGLVAAMGPLGALFTAGSIVGFGKNALDLGDQLGKLSIRTGIAAQKLSAYKRLADLSDVSQSKMRRGLKTLSKNMLEANKGTQLYARAFKSLGVEHTDSSGRLRKTDEVFEDIADKFSQMEDGSEKAAISMALFGGSGEQLIPMLNAGSEEMKKLTIRMADDFPNRSQRFNDTMETLGRKFQEVVIAVTDFFLPVMQDVADAFLNLFATQEDFSAFGHAISFIFKTVAAAVYTTIAGFRFLTRVLDDIFKMLGFVAQGDFGAAANVASKGLQETAEQAKKDREAFQNIFEGESTGERKTDNYASRLRGGGDTQIDLEALQAGGKTGEAERKKEEDRKKRAAQQLQSSQRRTAAKERELAILEETDALEKIGLEFDDKRATLKEKLADDLARALTTDEKTALQNAYNLDIEILRTQEAEKRADEIKRAGEEAERAAEKARKKLEAIQGKDFGETFKEAIKNMGKLGENLGNTLAGAFQAGSDALADFITTGTANFSEFARGMLRDLARVFMRFAMFTALKNVFGLTFSAKGNVFDKGMKPTPYAKGGVVEHPTFFRYGAQGNLGVMGEAGAEAVMPLKRDSKGNLGVITTGGGGGGVAVTVNVDAKGTAASGDEGRGAQLGRYIARAVQEELVVQRRPGGLLAT